VKAILIYELPEEKEEFNLAISGCKYYSALFDIFQELRTIIKRELLPDKVKDAEDRYEVVEYIRDHLWQVMDDNNVNLDEGS